MASIDYDCNAAWLQRCVAATCRAGDVADRVEPGAHPSTIGIIAISIKAENAHSDFNYR
jgi:hypothetical protein